MQNIFLGMLFLFLDFDINLGEATIGLLPDFVGYILMVKGLEEMAVESPQFEKARPFAVGMAVYTGVLYAMDFLALSVQMRFLGWVLGLVAMAVSLLISRWIVLGILETEQRRQRNLEGAHLDSVWRALAAVQVIACVFGWFPVVGGICALAAFVTGICYLVAFHNTKKLYLDSIGLE